LICLNAITAVCGEADEIGRGLLRRRWTRSDTRCEVSRWNCSTEGITAMLQFLLRHRVREIAHGLVALVVMGPAPGAAQTPIREGNESDFKDWQPTRGGVAAEEQAAGIREPTKQRNAEDQALEQIPFIPVHIQRL
jgi:hypothetical protein